MSGHLSAEWFSEQLAPHAEDIGRRLLGKVTRHGREIHCAAKDSPLGCKVAVVISGTKQGLVMIYDGATTGGGGLLKLIYETDGGRDWTETFKWARRYLGLSNEEIDPVRKMRMDREAAERQRRREAEEKAVNAKRVDDVRRIWRETQHIKGTLGEEYFAKRGLNRHHLETAEIRFHPNLKHSEGGSYPAIVARVVDSEKNGIAIWRIYLNPKTGLKAPVSQPKMGLGPAAGGAVRLGDDGRADEIAVVEGIETGLAVRELLMWQMPVWCGLATSGMAGLVVPDRIMFVRIYPDGDKGRTYRKVRGVEVPLPPGEVIQPPGLVAATALQKALKHIGRDSVIEEVPPAGSDYLDILIESKKGENEPD